MCEESVKFESQHRTASTRLSDNTSNWLYFAHSFRYCLSNVIKRSSGLRELGSRDNTIRPVLLSFQYIYRFIELYSDSIQTNEANYEDDRRLESEGNAFVDLAQ